MGILDFVLPIIKYIHQFRKFTLEETSGIGFLYYLCIILVNLTLILVLVVLILKYLSFAKVNDSLNTIKK